MKIDTTSSSSQARILLLGVTGRVGGATLRSLNSLASPASLRVITRRPAALPSDLAESAEIVVGDFTDQGTIKSALKGVDSVLLVTGDNPQMAAQEISLINAAREVEGIKIVQISAITAGLANRVSFGRYHGEVEDHLVASGLDYVILRPTFFFQSLELFAKPIRSGYLPASTKAGAIGFVDLNDVGAVAAKALVDPSLDGALYNLTGPRTWTMSEVAAAIAEVASQPVRHVSPPQCLMAPLLRIGGKLDAWTAKEVAELMQYCARGAEDVVTEFVPKLLGRPASDLHDYLVTNRAIYSR